MAKELTPDQETAILRTLTRIICSLMREAAELIPVDDIDRLVMTIGEDGADATMRRLEARLTA